MENRQGIIGVESLQDFLGEAVPSFRDDCLAHGAPSVTTDNLYLLLMLFYDHLKRLQSEHTELSAFMMALGAVNALLERGSPSVHDAAVIEVVDMMIGDDAVREPAMRSGYKAVKTAIEEQTRNWEEYRQQRKR